LIIFSHQYVKLVCVFFRLLVVSRVQGFLQLGILLSETFELAVICAHHCKDFVIFAGDRFGLKLLFEYDPVPLIAFLVLQVPFFPFAPPL
jgi:hypothetical protein